METFSGTGRAPNAKGATKWSLDLQGKNHVLQIVTFGARIVIFGAQVVTFGAQIVTFEAQIVKVFVVQI